MHTAAEKLYQSGADRSKAVAAGCAFEFDRLETLYNGGSIPAHIWGGFKYRKPYSCAYHTGGAAGAQLRRLCRT